MYVLYKAELSSKYTTEVLEHKYYKLGTTKVLKTGTTQLNNTSTTTQITTTTFILIFQNI